MRNRYLVPSRSADATARERERPRPAPCRARSASEPRGARRRRPRRGKRRRRVDAPGAPENRAGGQAPRGAVGGGNLQSPRPDPTPARRSSERSWWHGSGLGDGGDDAPNGPARVPSRPAIAAGSALTASWNVQRAAAREGTGEDPRQLRWSSAAVVHPDASDALASEVRAPFIRSDRTSRTAASAASAAKVAGPAGKAPRRRRGRGRAPGRRPRGSGRRPARRTRASPASPIALPERSSAPGAGTRPPERARPRRGRSTRRASFRGRRATSSSRRRRSLRARRARPSRRSRAAGGREVERAAVLAVGGAGRAGRGACGACDPPPRRTREIARPAARGGACEPRPLPVLVLAKEGRERVGGRARELG